MTIVTHASGVGSIPLRRAPRPVASSIAANAAFQPNRRFEHPDEREGHRAKERAAERDRTVAGVAVTLRESSAQTGPKEEK